MVRCYSAMLLLTLRIYEIICVIQHDKRPNILKVHCYPMMRFVPVDCFPINYLTFSGAMYCEPQLKQHPEPALTMKKAPFYILLEPTNTQVLVVIRDSGVEDDAMFSTEDLDFAGRVGWNKRIKTMVRDGDENLLFIVITLKEHVVHRHCVLLLSFSVMWRFITT